MSTDGVYRRVSRHKATTVVLKVARETGAAYNQFTYTKASDILCIAYAFFIQLVGRGKREAHIN